MWWPSELRKFSVKMGIDPNSTYKIPKGTNVDELEHLIMTAIPKKRSKKA